MEVDDAVCADAAGATMSMAARFVTDRLRRRQAGQLWLLCFVLGAGALGLVADPAGASAASSLYVTSEAGGSDLNPCSETQPCASIHHAIEVASEGGTISVGPGTFTEGGSKELILSKSLRIEGSSGAHATIVQGGASAAAFAISGSHEVTLAHLTIQDPASAGVGVRNNGGRVTIAESTVSDSAGNGIESGTGASTSVTIADSTIAHNAIGVVNDATVTITDSTIAENTSTGVYAFAATTNILDSTIVDNSGYGLQAEGGTSATLAGSILAGNSKGDCSFAVTDAGYNIASDESCVLSASTSISKSSSIDLGVLSQNGGPSETELPGTESAAVERIPAAASATIAGKSAALCEGTTDQRGIARPKVAGGKCTIGAVEPVSFTRYVASTGSDAGNTICASTMPCKTISHAIEIANGGDVISVGPGKFTEDLVLEKDLTIEGSSGAAATTVGDVLTSHSTAVSVAANVRATLARLTISSPEEYSVGVSSFDAAVTITESLITGGSEGSGVSSSGATGTTTIADSTVSGEQGVAGYNLATIIINGSTLSGGSVSGLHLYNGAIATISDTTTSGYGEGVDVQESSRVTITDSTFSHDNVGVDSQGGGVDIGDSTFNANNDGVYIYHGDAVTITASTISGSSSDGVVNRGGAATSISDSTIVGNKEAGVYSEGKAAATSVINSTIAANAEYGVRNDEGATTTLAGSVVASNTKGDCLTEIEGTITDAGYNLAEDATCPFSAAHHSLVSTPAQLGILGQNGGPTETAMQMPQSQVVERIPAGSEVTISSGAVALCAGSDQRGVPRPSYAGGRCDIGAVELAPSRTALSGSPTGATAGQMVTLTATVASAIGTPALPAPQGNVAFTAQGGTAIPACQSVPLVSIAGALQATCITSTLSAGTDALSARYTPVAGYHGSVGSLTLTIAAPGSGSTGTTSSAGTTSSSTVTASPTASARSTGITSATGTGTPVLSALRIAPRAFRATPRGPSAQATADRKAKRRKAKSQKPKGGASLSFDLNRAASVLFKVTERLPARRAKKGRCAKQTRAEHRARRCTRRITLKGSFRTAGVKGPNSLYFSGRLSGRKLPAGSYMLIARPSVGGSNGAAHSIAFRIAH